MLEDACKEMGLSDEAAEQITTWIVNTFSDKFF